MPSYAILRFVKIKAGGVAGIYRHDERTKRTFKSNPDIDLTRTHENYHIIKPEGSYMNQIRKRIQEAGCTERSNSVVMVETIITASSEFINSLPPDEEREFFHEATNFLIEKIGRENILSAVVHKDETTPHMHITFVPITRDNRLTAKEILGNKTHLRIWQDEYYAHMEKRWPNLDRGISAELTQRPHIPTQTYKQAKELDSLIPEIYSALEDINAFNAANKRKEALKILKKSIPKMATFSSNLSEYKERISDLTSRLDASGKANDAFQEQVKIEMQKWADEAWEQMKKDATDSIQDYIKETKDTIAQKDERIRTMQQEFQELQTTLEKKLKKLNEFMDYADYAEEEINNLGKQLTAAKKVLQDYTDIPLDRLIDQYLRSQERNNRGGWER